MSNEASKMPEIKPGHLIKNEFGRFFLVVSEAVAYRLAKYNKGLILAAMSDDYFKQLDRVVAIYGNLVGWLSVSELEDIVYKMEDKYLLWRRPDPIKEMTMSELEEHFGCKVKIVKKED